MKVTGLTRDKHVKARLYLKLAGGGSFPVSSETVAKYGLAVGADIDEANISPMLEEDEKKRALDASFNLLSYSRRSRKELTERLKRKSFSLTAIEHALDRLEELKYVDDSDFARNLLLLRRSQGKGPELIIFEMKRKGITQEIMDGVFRENPLSSQAEAESILPLARKKLALMRALTKEDAARRLMGFLARRGFSLETVRSVLTLLKKAPEID